ncbi:2-hydroxychromene-2-carboxylate isomerase [Marinospirillum insulare]|uniref:2-hydroxychromene-2-carboxylate isomerase n=1 Tax=Marinospirillum insulare TaxID=217169 RepID=A0ABQ6A264_9GAMM|nr:DsbA family protein [Marinospirillum insulare]GLR64199.1 2-hydroxychromene-2-carboxylate isomerase [Marinospirillum insulare]
MTEQVDFYFDIVSPYSFLAATQIAELEAKTAAKVTWKPISLGSLFKKLGNAAPLSNMPKINHMFGQDLPRLAKYFKVEYKKPEVFPTDTRLVQAALAVSSAEQRADLTRALYQAYWCEGRDVAPLEVAEEVLGKELTALGGSDEARAALKGFTDELIERGGFGAPIFFWKDQMYFGSDRLPVLTNDLLAAKG